ncbi:MAG TPA: AEC family transporter [Alphaproteobacteria bacterium]|nr:AEC family transporter [Alphaproteobacteria bacterium]
MTNLVSLFILVAVGALLRRVAIPDAHQVRGLGLFVYYAALPALVAHKMAFLDLGVAMPWGMIAAYLASMAGAVVLTYLLSLAVRGMASDRRHVLLLAAMAPNVGYVGLPIVLSAFGDRAVLPGIIIVLIENVITVGAMTAVLGSHARKDTHPPSAAQVAKTIATSPLIAASLIGTAISLSGLPKPALIFGPMELLAQAAIPVALIVLGASLPLRWRLADLAFAWPAMVGKLLLQPAVFLLVALLLAVPEFDRTVGLINVACPAAINLFLVSNRYQVQQDVVATLVLMTTLGSVATMTALLWMAGL